MVDIPVPIINSSNRSLFPYVQCCDILIFKSEYIRQVVLSLALYCLHYQLVASCIDIDATQ